MVQHSRTPATSGPSSLSRTNIFGPAPLLEGEDAAAYDELLARVSGAVKPTDILEEVWVRDVVDLTWEVFRMRRLKVNLMKANAHKGLVEVLEPLTDVVAADVQSKLWAMRRPDTIKEVNKRSRLLG